jgi:hypothetical protein
MKSVIGVQEFQYSKLKIWRTFASRLGGKSKFDQDHLVKGFNVKLWFTVFGAIDTKR